MELPDINAVFVCGTDYCVVVARVKHDIRDRESVSNESLIKERNCLLRFVVPYFNQIISTPRQHETSVETKISCVD